MKIEAWYLGRRVYVNVPASGLVFDGTNYVDPADAKTLELAAWYPKVVDTEIDGWSQVRPVQYTAHNIQICEVIGIHSQEVDVSDVITVADPSSGDPVWAVTIDNKGNRVLAPVIY